LRATDEVIAGAAEQAARAVSPVVCF